MAQKVVRFQNSTVGRQQGELGRFRVLGGPDVGLVFVVMAPSITVGRGQDCDVVLTDLKVSRKHLELNISGGTASVKDLGSAHGIAINGAKNDKAIVKTRDKIGIGQTVLEYIGPEVGATQVMSVAPTTTSAALGSGSGLTQFIPRTGSQSSALGYSGSSSGGGEEGGTFLERNKKVVFLLGGLMALAVLLPEAEKEHKKRTKQGYTKPRDLQNIRSISALSPPKVDKRTRKTSEMYFKRGFREYQSKNYSRAIAAFETALQVNSRHALAKIYLENSRNEMAEDGKELILSGKRDESALRFRSALIKYNSVRRLYKRDQTHELYKEADTLHKELKEKIKRLEEKE